MNQLPIPEPQRSRIKELKRMAMTDRENFWQYARTKKCMNEAFELKKFLLESEYADDLEAAFDEVRKELNP